MGVHIYMQVTVLVVIIQHYVHSMLRKRIYVAFIYQLRGSLV